MNLRSLSHLSNQELLRRLAALAARDRGTTAELLAHIAETDERRLYAHEGFPSMFAYCVQVLLMSEDIAFKRIRAARTARQFPAIFDAVADGRLHLSGVVVLTPYLTPENSDELLEAAAHKTRAEIEWLLAERFPRPDLPERVEVLSPEPALSLSAGPTAGNVKEPPRSLAPGPVACSAPRGKVIPLSAERVGLQTSIAIEAYENLRYAQALLGLTTDLAEVIERASELIVREAEKQKFCATSRPRARRRGSSADPRHIPAAVKRAVWVRDGGQCGFVSESGQRCPARTKLEYDHVDPVARGGEATVEGIRIRCRTHNQFEAECVFGAGFMSEKREAAMRAAAARRAKREGEAAERVEALKRAAAECAAGRERVAAERAAERERVAAARAADREAQARARTEAADPEKDVTPWLRQLGVRGEQAHRLAASCDALPPETRLAERVRFALRQLAPPHRHVA
jgi:hypothetical protein